MTFGNNIMELNAIAWGQDLMSSMLMQCYASQNDKNHMNDLSPPFDEQIPG